MDAIEPEDVESAGLSLPESGIFEGMSREELDTLSQFGTWVEANNEVVVIQDALQEYLFYIHEGEAELSHSRKLKSGSIKKESMGTLVAGKSIGEMAFLNRENSTSRATVPQKATMWCLHYDNFIEFLGYPGGQQLCLNLARSLSMRIRNGNEKVVSLTAEIGAHLQGNKSKGDNAALAQIEEKLAAFQQGKAQKKTKTSFNWPLWVAGIVFMASLYFPVTMAMKFQNASLEGSLAEDSMRKAKEKQKVYKEKHEQMLAFQDKIGGLQESVKDAMAMVGSKPGEASVDTSGDFKKTYESMVEHIKSKKYYQMQNNELRERLKVLAEENRRLKFD